MEATNPEPIRYCLVQHETTGALWAIKTRGKVVLGARSFEDRDQPYIEDLPGLTYDVGTPREYAQEMHYRFAVWPFTKNRPAEMPVDTDN